jgi:acyl-CoA oxidase
MIFGDKFSKRQGWFDLLKDPLWVPEYNVPLPQQRETALQRLKLTTSKKLVSVRDFKNDVTNIFTAHEMLGGIDPSTGTKFTVQFNLFGGTIMGMHTERHAYIFDKIDSLEAMGCFLLTEVGYGANAVKMESTATFDQSKQEFVLSTPTPLSYKYWITNGACHANHALMFAQTIVKGKNEGVNAFLVRIRDGDLKEMPGVSIHDMGWKMGLNGVDNALLKFGDVRVPREAMLNRLADVTPEGNFVCDV